MRYAFKDMLTVEIYQSTRVMFILGNYNLFNNMVADELKNMCIDEALQFNGSIGVSDEFGIDENAEESASNSVDFNTFMDVIGVPNINGKWFCRIDLSALTKKQTETLLKYMKDPNENGILVVSSTDWLTYKDWLKNRILGFSRYCHLMELSFPHRDVLKVLVEQLFNESGLEIDHSGIELFTLKMSRAYDEYEQVIQDIANMHKGGVITSKELKVYMKGIEHYIIDDFIRELTKPMSSDKTNSKKILKIMSNLEDEYTAKNLVYRLIKLIDEAIEFRLLINSGKIPIGINYFFKDVINDLGGETGPYGKMSEWKFRRKAMIASETSLKDWEYMRIILGKAVENVKLTDDEMELKCRKALYELCTRSVLTNDRINNIIDVDNVLVKPLVRINRIIYDEEKLSHIQDEIELANNE